MQAITTEGLPMLKITTKTWSRDSHGLYDYEATQTKNNNILISGKDTKLIRKKNDVRQCSLDTDIDLDERELSRVRFDGSK